MAYDSSCHSLQYGHWKSLTSMTHTGAFGDPSMRLASAALVSESVAVLPASGDAAAGDDAAADGALFAVVPLARPSALEQASETIEAAATTASPLTRDGRIP